MYYLCFLFPKLILIPVFCTDHVNIIMLSPLAFILCFVGVCRSVVILVSHHLIGASLVHSIMRSTSGFQFPRSLLIVMLQCPNLMARSVSLFFSLDNIYSNYLYVQMKTDRPIYYCLPAPRIVNTNIISIICILKSCKTYNSRYSIIVILYGI